MRKTVYVAGPYTAPTHEGIAENISQARFKSIVQEAGAILPAGV